MEGLAFTERPLIKRLINKTEIIIIRAISKTQNIIRDIIKASDQRILN